MPYIKVDVDKIYNYQQELQNTRNKVNTISSRFVSTANALDYDVKSKNDISRKLRTISSCLDEHEVLLLRMNSFMGQTATAYKNTDRAVVTGKRATVSVAVSHIGNAVLKKETPPPNTLTFSEEETDVLIGQVAAEAGVSKKTILDDLVKGGEKASKWLGDLKKIAKTSETGFRILTGSTNVIFTAKGAQVIVSGFTRSSVLNNLTEALHGKGIGTHYLPENLLKTKGIGTLYALDKVADSLGKITSGVERTVKVLDSTGKIRDILNDDSLSKKEKFCNATAVGITTAASIALDVAAPIAGKATKTVVTALIPVPGVNVVAGIVAGAVVESALKTVSKVMTSEAVVKQTSKAVANVGDAVVSGKKAVSNAAKKVLQSKNAGEAIKNTAKLVGTAIAAKNKVVNTVVKETAKVVATVAKETVKTVVNDVKKAAKKVANWVKKW